jgi:outer membrane protein W
MSRSLTSLVGALLLTVTFTNNILAQDAASDVIRPITKSGSSAFIFSIAGLGAFGLNGAVIGDNKLASDENRILTGFGMKYFLTDEVALRVLIGARISEQGAEDIPGGKTDQNLTGGGLGLEYHFRPLYSTSPYLGAQFGVVTYNMQHSTSAGEDRNVKRTTINIGAIGGFNWFFTRGIALGGEYGLGAAFTSGSNTEGVGAEKKDIPSNTDVSFDGTGSVQLIVFF